LGVDCQKVPIGGGDTLDQPSAVHLFDAQGRLVESIGRGGPSERGLAQLKALLNRQRTA